MKVEPELKEGEEEIEVDEASSSLEFATLLGRNNTHKSLSYRNHHGGQKKNKQVRFAYDENGNLANQVKIIERIVERSESCSGGCTSDMTAQQEEQEKTNRGPSCLDERTLRQYDKSDVWWTKQEMNWMRQNCIHLIGAFRRNEQYLWALSVLYEELSSSSSLSASRCRRRNNTNGNYCCCLSRAEDCCVEDNSLFERASQLLLSCWDDARGIETSVHDFSIIRAHRNALLNFIYSDSSLEDRDNSIVIKDPYLIRKQSREISRTSGLFAAKMAEMDAHQASIAYS